MKRPTIGVTMDGSDDGRKYELYLDYVRAVEKAGGLPLAIPYAIERVLIPELLESIDGILFTGGNDLDPATYGQAWHPRALKLDPCRQAFELALMKAVEQRRLPTLCICLGCQVLNVHRGGTLHQFIPDLPDKLEHRKLNGNLLRHRVTIQPGSAVAKAVGKAQVSTNTYHKQAVDRVGRGLVVTARADDGIIEALEDPSFPLLAGIQWHPERLIDEPEHLALFEMLVRHARG